MKKNNSSGNNLTEKVPIKHFLLIMRTTFILLFICVFYTMAEVGYTQNARVTINKRNTTLKEVLNEIERQTDYLFIYNNEVNTNEKVSIRTKERTVSEVLNSLLKDKEMNYSMEGNHIILSKIENRNYTEEGFIENITQQQKKQISGTVVDEAGIPIIGANIIEVGTTNGSITDTDGNFTLNVEDGAIIRISYIGYLEQDIRIGNQNNFKITLREDTQALEELVVVGYGIQKKVNLTGSIAVIDSESLENRSFTNASQALQGVKGLYVNQAGGRPGADGATIRIRGVGTIGGSGKLNPLVLVDGIETTLMDVNPNDIESISILKDAASASIYGSRAANGVILITTKVGKTDKPVINYNGYIGMQSSTILPDPVDDSATFMEWYNKAMVNQGGIPYYSNELIQEFRNNPTSLLYPNTNWMDVLFGNAFIHEHNLRLSGGTNTSKYNFSTSFMDQDGVLKGMTGAKKYSLNLRIQQDFSERFKVDVGLIANRWDIEQPSEGISTAMNRIMRMVPVQPVGRMENGDWPDSWVTTPGQNSFQNPLVLKEDHYGKEQTNRLLANLSAFLKITNNLQYEARGSVNYRNLLRKNFAPVTWLHDVRTGNPTRHPWSSTGVKTEYTSNDERVNFTHTLRYTGVIKDIHNISLLAGNSIEQYTSSSRQAQKTGYPNKDLDELEVGTMDPTVAGSSLEDALISYFGRFQYDFKNKYLFEANIRYDGSSRFAAGNRWGLFPSFSAGWRISEEDFMGKASWIDELKFRGSWGQIGNQDIGRFQYVNAISLGYGYPFGGKYDGGGVAITQYRDPKIKWETTTMTNIGVDWSFLRGKISGEFEYFYKRTKDILRGIALPAQIGALAGPTTNLAVVDNYGIELGLNYQAKIGKDFSYQIGGNFTYIKNNVVDLDGETIISGGRITKEGSPIDSWYVLQTDGLFQSQEEVDNYPTITNRVGPGDIKYVDRNNDGVIDGEDRYIAGNTFPTYTYGFNIGFSYKSISLSTIWQGVADISVRPNLNMASPFNNGAGITKDWLTDSWTPENKDARLPRITARNQYTAENFSDSDFWLENASYLRLKNIQLNYELSRSIFDKIGFISRANVFVNAENILTFTNARLFDPERDIVATNIDQYPTVKTISLGLNITF